MPVEDGEGGQTGGGQGAKTGPNNTNKPQTHTGVATSHSRQLVISKQQKEDDTHGATIP